MNWNKPSTGQPGPKKPVIKRQTVQVAIRKPPGTPAAPARPENGNRFKLTPATTKSSKSRVASADTTPSQSPTPKKLTPKKTVEKRALAHSRGVKRASADPMFSDDEDDSSDLGGSDSDASRKRIKSSASSVDNESGPRRTVGSDEAFSESAGPLKFIHGADATSGAHKWENPWGMDKCVTVELQYPSRSPREKFELKLAKGNEYAPMDDILNTIQTIATFYFPEELSKTYTDDTEGFCRKLNRAYRREDISEWVSTVKDFNNILTPLVKDGSVQKELRGRARLHLDWVKRILDQIFARTVSPQVELLNAYTNGGDNVYGELLPRFISDIFKHTKLNHEQTFIDLGSGVANVVLQAALEIGCESWGIEMMKNPCDLADLQAEEFTARSRLWGLKVGDVQLLRGDMTKHEKIPPLLQRADVILVNNQAFTPELNDKLRDMFLDLKTGAKIVSLKPFVPVGHKMALRNIDSPVNQFVQEEREYFSESVSWSHYGNEHWYIATKDTRPMQQFRLKMGLDKP